VLICSRTSALVLLHLEEQLARTDLGPLPDFGAIAKALRQNARMWTDGKTPSRTGVAVLYPTCLFNLERNPL